MIESQSTLYVGVERGGWLVAATIEVIDYKMEARLFKRREIIKLSSFILTGLFISSECWIQMQVWGGNDLLIEVELVLEVEVEVEFENEEKNWCDH